MNGGQPQQYRVEADWQGGGFGYTKPFASESDALAWGHEKARAHRDAIVTARLRDEREPGDLSEADLAEIDAAYHIDLRSGALERRREHRAIEQQVNDFRMAGLL